jgi:hypothetical protein
MTSAAAIRSHSREGGNPCWDIRGYDKWIPASAGMTADLRRYGMTAGCGGMIARL